MQRVALVTGANQGLGLALVRGLGRAWGESGVVYLGARDEARGAAAVAQLRAEGVSARLALVDVTDAGSVARARDAIAGEHGGIDVVVSNAAQRMTREVAQAEQVARFVDTNNFGQRRITDAFRELLRPGARLLVVASMFGSLRQLDPRLHARFDVEHATLDDIDATMRAYVQAVVEGRDRAEGWPQWMNVPSKIGQVASMKVLARELASRRAVDGVLVAAVCPGLVDTEASRPWFADMSQALTPDAAAAPIVALATAPADAALPHGELVQHGKVVPWR